MLHPTVKSRLICVRRLFLHPFIKFFFKVLGTLLTATINNMTVVSPLLKLFLTAGVQNKVFESLL